MKIGIFSVFDSKAEAYLPPFYALNARVAVRNMQQAVTDQSHNFCKYAEDYTLFEIGVFDDSTGVFKDLQPKISLGNAAQMRNNMKPIENINLDRENTGPQIAQEE